MFKFSSTFIGEREIETQKKYFKRKFCFIELASKFLKLEIQWPGHSSYPCTGLDSDGDAKMTQSVEKRQWTFLRIWRMRQSWPNRCVQWEIRASKDRCMILRLLQCLYASGEIAGESTYAFSCAYILQPMCVRRNWRAWVSSRLDIGLSPSDIENRKEIG